jgi:hypothetical protein
MFSIGTAQSHAAPLDLTGVGGQVSDITIGGLTFTPMVNTLDPVIIEQDEEGLGVRTNPTLGDSSQIDNNGKIESLKGTAAGDIVFNSVTVSRLDSGDTVIVKIGTDEIEVTFSGLVGGTNEAVISLGGLIGSMIEFTVPSIGNKDNYKVKALDIDFLGQQPVPEPTSVALVGLGLFALIGYKRRR